MINLKELKVNEEYYIVDKNGCYDDILIKFKVINKLKGGEIKGLVEVQFLKYMYDYGEQDVQYDDQKDDEVIIEKIYKDDEERLFRLDDINEAHKYLEIKEEESEIERRIFEMENHIPAHEYPDWDGDESIMYYIDNYRETDDDDDDEDYDDLEDDED